jgi:hypothetical protein
MKIQLVLSLLLISSFSFALEAVRIPTERRIQLNREFSQSIEGMVERFGSGDIVGNGGGLLEQNFSHAYFSVQTAIENCLTNSNCFTSFEQKKILKEINELYIQKLSQKNILIFAKNSETNNFFFDQHDQTERLAKTGFSPEHPIFINVDLAKSIQTDIPAMISILIHELGHQIGIANHSYLDHISAKVRRIWEANWEVSTIKVDKKELSTRLFSTKRNYINAKLSYVYDGKVKSLNAKIFDLLKCRAGEELYGFYLSNGHWKRPVSTKEEYSVKMSYWLDTYCESLDGSIWPIEKDLTIEFKFNKAQGKITDLSDVSLQVN